MQTQPSRRCGACGGFVPDGERQCPHCQRSVASYGALGRLFDAILPQDRPVTKLLIAACVGLYALVGLASGGLGLVSPSVYSLIRFGASFGPYISEGEWWRLVTALFLHGNLLHLAFNMYGLWITGSLIEGSFGRLRFLIALVVTGVASTACTLLWSFVGPDLYALLPGLEPVDARDFTVSLVGISGALTGLMGVGVTAGHKVGNAQGRAVRDVMLRWMGFLLVFGLVAPGIGNVAHVSGFLVGLPLGWLLPLRERSSFVMGWVWAALGALCGGLVIVSLGLQFIALPRQYPNDAEEYPLSLFGKELREGSFTESRRVQGLQQACMGALGELEGGASGEARAQALERAQVNCDEWVYLIPLNPAYFYASAAAHLEAGDLDFGCRRLETARRMTLYGRGLPEDRREDFAEELQAFGRREGCP